MTLSDYIKIISAISGLLFIGVIARRAGWFKIIGGTNALLRGNVEALETNNKLQYEQIALLKSQLKVSQDAHTQDKAEFVKRHNENIVEIAKLQGKVETLTALPLEKIDRTLVEFTTFGKLFVESNNKILAQLKSTATIAAEDRDVLTNQNKHIRDEVGKAMDKNVPAVAAANTKNKDFIAKGDVVKLTDI